MSSLQPPSGTPPTGAGTRLTATAPTLPAEDLSQDRLLAALPRDGQGRPLLGRMPIVCRIGRGGMGAVYYAVHPRLQVEVAVKVLPFNLVEQDPKLVERFVSEARMAAALSNDHVVRVLDVDHDADTHFLVMEYVAGESAGTFLKRRKAEGNPALTEAEALQIVTAATRGLAAAHRQGIIHRDIKPDNILIPKGDLARAKLADLGLAKPEGSGQSLGTQSNIAMGTPGYMAPEQIEDARTAGPPADVFSMGATLYALLSGKAPFAGTSLGVVLRDTATKDPDPLPSGVQPSTRALVDRCLSKDPKRRFVNAIDLLATIEALSTTPVAPIEPLNPTLQSIPEAVKPGRRAVWPLAIVAVILIGGGIAIWKMNSSTSTPAPSPTVAATPGPDRKMAYRAFITSAENAQVDAELKDTVEAWEKVLEACAGAEANAPGADEQRTVQGLTVSAKQRRDWAAARALESKGDLDGALKWAVKASMAKEPPRDLVQYKESLVAKKKETERLAARKSEYDGRAAKAREEKDLAAAVELWKKALESADQPADQKESRDRIDGIVAEMARIETDRKFEAAMKAGNEALSAGKFDDAEARFKEALVAKPGNGPAAGALEEVRNRRAFEAAMEEGRRADKAYKWTESHAAFERALKLKPDSAVACAACGNARRIVGDHDGALKALNEAVRLDPKLARAWAFRGRVSRDPDGGLKDAEEAIRLDPTEAEGWNTRGIVRTNSDRLDDAIKDFQEAIRLEPRAGKLWANLANARTLAGDRSGALKDYDEAIRIEPAFPLPWSSRGLLREQIGELDGAIKDYTEFLRLDPKSAWGWTTRGNARRVRGDHAAALKDYDEAIRLDPTYSWALGGRGDTHYALHNYDAALKDYDEMIRLSPKNASAWNGRGNARRSKGDVDGSIKDYDEAIRIDPSFQWAWCNRGDQKQAKGDHAGAIKDYTEAIRLDPRYVQALYGRGYPRKSLGDLDGALADFDEALRLNPRHAWAWAGRGDVRTAKGDREGALKDYDESLQLDPKYRWAWARRGDLRHSRREYDAAIKNYDELIRLDPSAGPSWNVRGISKAAKGDVDGAITDYSEAIRLDPGSKWAWINRGLARNSKADYDGALKDYDEAIRLDPKNVDAWINRGVAFSFKSDPDGAIRNYTEAIRLDPKSSLALSNRGLARQTKVDYAGAAADFEEALRVAPANWHMKAAVEGYLKTARGLLNQKP